ncbi:glycosyltransferase [uncultured Amnibacterium sp.]|uniref:glycosyltransferase n=1 Tax=uncultured Amnibacterium sp. TaxID=1631851 RepID=UPI0035CC6355
MTSVSAAFDSAVAPDVVRTGVHVVTVTHNSASTIEAYFAGIEACAADIAGVTIVDNASTDDTLDRVRAALQGASVPVEVIENENSGFAGGYYAASCSSVQRGLPVLCLNPDVALAEGAVDAMLDVLDSFPDAAVVTVPLVGIDGSPDTASRRRLPTLGASMLYSVLGRLTPSRLRYNRREADAAPMLSTRAGRPVNVLQATTGALMLVAADFRTLDEGVFDRDYWMYGEDLQLCADAAASGRRVLIVEVAPSVHVKGVSSGRPRSHRSNRAFHDAMYRYAQKNLVRHPVMLHGLRLGVEAHFVLTEAKAFPVRLRSRAAARV